VATTITGAGGAFDFRLRPDRDTRYRVSAPGLPAHERALVSRGGRTALAVVDTKAGSRDTIASSRWRS
jgi:hypothetical protein